MIKTKTIHKIKQFSTSINAERTPHSFLLPFVTRPREKVAQFLDHLENGK